ncbi:MAG: alpha-ketoglutarate-dependent dioxygenase AlkB [Acidimicrobiales bacterium]|nr:alpha-ketoglutarate-dependent dioxygenase AlkB [Acidimicrobiales bacterium]
MTRLVPREPEAVAPGAVHLPEWLDLDGQRHLVSACTTWVAQAGGLRAPRMPRGGIMSVQITCLGWHWYPYRYSRTVDDGDGRRVAPFPEWLGQLSRQAVASARALDGAVAGVEGEEHDEGAVDPAGFEPDVALVNWYGPGARMGMHADREETSPAPVVSLSVGDTCVFRFGNSASRGRPWTDVELGSGDLFVFGGPSRRAFHGVPRVVPGTAPAGLGLEGGRFNVTVRQTGLSG